jgi:hypothetical protein
LIAEIIALLIVRLFASALLFFVCIESSYEWSRWTAVLVSFSAVAIFFFIGIVVRREGRRAAAAWAHLLARISERLDFRAARLASGRIGVVQRADGFAIWTDVPCDLMAIVNSTSSRTLEEFSRLTGFPARVSRPVRIICFQKESAFASYMRGISPGYGRWRGNYSGRLRKRIVLFHDMFDIPPATFESVLAHELTHHFTRCNLRARPLWLQEGLAELVSGRVGDEGATDAPAQHRFKAAMARGQILPGKELYTVGYRLLHKRMKDWRNIEDASYCGRFYAQSAALLAWLRRKDEAAFKRFLAGLARAPVEANLPVVLQPVSGRGS